MFWNRNQYDKQSKEIVKSEVHEFSEIRELLILSSLKSASVARKYFEENDLKLLNYLIKIAGDFDDFGNAPINASYYIKEFPPELLKEYEEDIVNIFMNDDRSARTFLAIALGKIKTQ